MLVMEQGGWAQSCHPPGLPQIYFPRGVTPPPGAAMGGEVTVHLGRDLVLQEPQVMP